jgi:hypothetical protein
MEKTADVAKKGARRMPKTFVPIKLKITNEKMSVNILAISLGTPLVMCEKNKYR